MSAVLWDPLTGDPLLLAPARAARPHDTDAAGAAAAACPFCEGREAETPPEVLAVRPGGGPADGPGWLVRAFANKYPALPPEEGVHEIVVSTPRHVVSFGDLTDEEAGRAVSAWAERLRAIGADARGLCPFLFLNQGAAAGASLQHTHAQLVGLPVAPPRLVRREAAFAASSECPVCADLASADARLVCEAHGLVAWAPAVPPLSGTLRLAPRRHVPAWGDDLDVVAVGCAVRDLVRRVPDAFGVNALNLWLHQRRPGGRGPYHWHLELVPRRGTLAGLELGAGVVPLTQTPEEVAERMRAAGS